MKHVLIIDPSGYTAPTRQHELHRTDQESICSRADLDHEVAIGDLDHDLSKV